MGTTPNVKFYLTHGKLADILPQLYKAYGNKPFTESNAKVDIIGFKHGYLSRMDNLGIAVRVNGKSRMHLARGEPTQWILTPATCIAINEYYTGDCYGLRKKEKRAKG
jgi:hypothetical protein